MIIENLLREQLPLTPDMLVDQSNHLYKLAKRRYLTFFDENITKENASSLQDSSLLYPLHRFLTNYPTFPYWKTVIVVGTTTDTWQTNELVLSHGWRYGAFNATIGTVAVLYLINESQQKIYTNDERFPYFGMSYRKFVRQIHSIVERYCTHNNYVL